MCRGQRLEKAPGAFRPRDRKMAQALPIVFTELLNLTAAPLGIAEDVVKCGGCSLECDKYITCCEQGQVAIVAGLHQGSSAVICLHGIHMGTSLNQLAHDLQVATLAC